MRIEYHCIRIVYRKWIFSIWLSCHKSIFFLDFFGLKIQNARASKKRKKKLWKKPKRKQQANKLMVLSPRKAIGSENSTNKTTFSATKICQIFFFTTFRFFWFTNFGSFYFLVDSMKRIDLLEIVCFFLWWYHWWRLSTLLENQLNFIDE